MTQHVDDDLDEDLDDAPDAGPIDLPTAFRNILQVLQTDPRNYRRFGVYWWPVKALLKGAGYGRHQCYLLGNFQDPETAAMVPPADLQTTLRAALAEYGFNARFPHSDDRVENPWGELVLIVDDDAGL